MTHMVTSKDKYYCTVSGVMALTISVELSVSIITVIYINHIILYFLEKIVRNE